MKRILVAGAGGGLAVIFLSIVVNGIFGFRSRIDLNRIPEESRVYAVLKESIAAPGAYICNPQPAPDGGFPPGEPVFSIRYSGMGHEAAGSMFLLDLAVALVGPMIAAWLLSLASDRVLRLYSRRVGYFVVLGLLVAVISDLPKLGIGGYPLRSVLLLSAYDVVSWTLCGLVTAWLMCRGASAVSPPEIA